MAEALPIAPLDFDSDDEDTVTFLVKGQKVKCKKSLIIEKSSYFRAMFSGNYVENDKKQIEINNADPVVFNAMMQTLHQEVLVNYWGENMVLEVCKTANMFCLDCVKDSCKFWIIINLKPKNCFRLWYAAKTYGILDVARSSKLVAITQYPTVSLSDEIFDVDLETICEYLGNIHLQCESELEVFNLALRWCNKNFSKEISDEEKDAIIRFLFCIDFKKLTINEVEAMYKDVDKYPEVKLILKCVVDLKQNANTSNEFNDKTKLYATTLLQAKTRIPQGYPCIITQRSVYVPENINLIETEDGLTNKQKYVIQALKSPNVQRRKRSKGSMVSVTEIIQHFGSTSKAPPQQPEEPEEPEKNDIFNFAERNGSHLSAFYVDLHDNYKLKKLADIAPNYNENQSLMVIGYQHCFFVFGGKNHNNFIDECWKYDPIKGYGISVLLPFRRRDFEICTVDKFLCICGGYQYNNTWTSTYYVYNVEKSKWSDEKSLPTNSTSIKCCKYKNQLALLCIEQRSLWRSDVSITNNTEWRRIALTFWEPSPRIKCCNTRVLINYEDRLYLYNVDTDLVELCLEEEDKEFKLKRIDEPQNSYPDPPNSILISDEIYSLIKQTDLIGPVISMVKYNLNTKKFSPAFRKDPNGIILMDIVEKTPYAYKFRSKFHMFNTVVMNAINININKMPTVL